MRALALLSSLLACTAAPSPLYENPKDLPRWGAAVLEKLATKLATMEATITQQGQTIATTSARVTELEAQLRRSPAGWGAPPTGDGISAAGARVGASQIPSKAAKQAATAHQFANHSHHEHDQAPHVPIGMVDRLEAVESQVGALKAELGAGQVGWRTSKGQQGVLQSSRLEHLEEIHPERRQMQQANCLQDYCDSHNASHKDSAPVYIYKVEVTPHPHTDLPVGRRRALQEQPCAPADLVSPYFPPCTPCQVPHGLPVCGQGLQVCGLSRRARAP